MGTVHGGLLGNFAILFDREPIIISNKDTVKRFLELFCKNMNKIMLAKHFSIRYNIKNKIGGPHEQIKGIEKSKAPFPGGAGPVSYTHLTLPTTVPV